MGGRCCRVERYETFHMNALNTLIWRGKRLDLAEMRHMIHNIIDQILQTPLEEI